MKYLFVFIMFSLLGCRSTPKYLPSSQNYNDNEMGWVDENTFMVNAIGYPRLNGDSAEIESYEAAYELGITKIADAFIKEININSADIVKTLENIT